MTSPSVGLAASLTVTSFAVPVVAPVGSPWPMAPCACVAYELPAELNTKVSNSAMSTFPINLVCRVIVSSPFVIVVQVASPSGADTRVAFGRGQRDTS